MNIQDSLDRLEELGLDSIEFESNPSLFMETHNRQIRQGLGMIALLERNTPDLLRLGCSPKELAQDKAEVKSALLRLAQERQALEVASRALTFFERWSKCYTQIVKFKALCAAQIAGHNKHKEIEKKVKLLVKLALDEERQYDPFFQFQLEKAEQALKEVGCFAGNLRGASSGFSAFGASKSDWGRVIQNASGSHWLRKADRLAAPAARSIHELDEQEAICKQRFEAIRQEHKPRKVLTLPKR